MTKEIGKKFNKEENCWTSRQVLGVREVFRGIVVKDWVTMPVGSADFTQHNKALIKSC